MRVINQSIKSAGYESEVYTVSGVHEDKKSTYNPLLLPALLSSMMLSKKGEGEGECDPNNLNPRNPFAFV